MTPSVAKVELWNSSIRVNPMIKLYLLFSLFALLEVTCQLDITQ